jgi:hypothetical protein
MNHKRFSKWVNKGNIFSTAGFCFRFTTNKVFEAEASFIKNPTEWFRFCMQLTRKTNRAGFCMHITILSLGIEFLIYDKRQWDYKRNKFKKERPVSFEYF